MVNRRLPIGCGLLEASALEWGLCISGKTKPTEPERFAEPGMTVLLSDGRIYALYLQSVPFARPRFDDLINGLIFVIENDYPIRGKAA